MMTTEEDYLEKIKALQAKVWPASCPKQPIYPLGEKSIVDYLKHWANVVPDKAAIEFYGSSLSFSDLDKLSDQLAQYLVTAKVTKGDRVAVFMPNCPQYHIAYYGILKMGAILVPVSPLSKELELEHQLTDSGAKTILCFDALLPVVMPVCQKLGIDHILATSYRELRQENCPIPMPDLFDIEPFDYPAGVQSLMATLEGASDHAVEHVAALDDVAVLNYTGGTTGLPKGCVHTHGNLIYTVASYTPCIYDIDAQIDRQAASDQIILSFLPEFWIAGENMGLLMPTYCGATLVLLARWDAETYMAAVQEYKVNRTVLLIDSVDEILSHPKVNDYDLSSLNSTPCISFIKKLNADYRRRWHDLTGCILFEAAFGMTETHTCDTFTQGFQDDDLDLSFDPAFVGLPVPGTAFKVCDFETGALKPLGEEGELWVKTPSIMKGYWNNPEASLKDFSEGWFKTGDRGAITPEGFIRYLGRKKEMLKVNGMSVFPTEIETFLGRHPSFVASTVIGRKDDSKGEVPVAFIILKPGKTETEEDLRNWCKKIMASYKIPEFRFVDSLPMTATGKVKKDELAKLL